MSSGTRSYAKSVETVVGISTVYQRGKTQIPATIRKVLKVKDGDKVMWVLKDGEYVLRGPEIG